MTELIKITGLYKAYDKRCVFNDLSLTIHEGESIALVGHNGVGKSTLLKIIAELTEFQAGEMNHSRKLKFNYVPEHFPKLPITARQYLYNVAIIEGLSKVEAANKVTHYFKLFHMEKMVDKPLKVLSKGTLQKVSVIQAILCKPDVLLLDEPLSGQDVDAQKTFIQLVQAMRESKITIIMSCHEEFLIRELSDTAYIIHDGKLIQQGFKPKEEVDCLIFQSMIPIQPHIIERITTIFDTTIVEGTTITMYTKPEISNKVIKYMFKLQFELRGMQRAKTGSIN